MTKDVLITIKGLRIIGEENEDIEVITPGKYIYENGKHNVVYEEPVEGMKETTINTVIIDEDSMHIKKEGITSAVIRFDTGMDKSIMNYSTPYGDVMFGIRTDVFKVSDEHDNLMVDIKYSMFMEEELVSECTMTVGICSKMKAKVDLQ